MSDLPIELQRSAAEAVAVLHTADRLRSVGIEPSAVMMQSPPGINIDELPSCTFVGIPVVWVEHPGISLVIGIR